MALPDDNDLPAVIFKELIVLLVPLLVSLDLVDPKLSVRLRNLTTTLVSMPEASIDKDRCMVLSHHDIRFPRNTFYVEAVAIAVVPQPFPHLQFWLGIAAVDVRHHKVTLGWSEAVGHGKSRFCSSSTVSTKKNSVPGSVEGAIPHFVRSLISR